MDPGTVEKDGPPRTTTSEPDAVVIGAGPCGVGTALALKDRGLRPLVLEKDDRVANAWRARYDRLRLNTCRPFSHLPDRRFPRGTPMFPTRDDLVEHIERHADEPGVDYRFATRAERIDRENGRWRVRTPEGDVRTRQVVVTTGHQNTPAVPDWEGRERFGGRLLHSAEYRDPQPFRGASVLVVGPGSSGMEIAFDLAEGGAQKVWLAVRTPPNILLREGPGGLPGDMLGVAMLRLPTRIGDALARFGRKMDIGDLTAYGLPAPREGVMSRLRRLGVSPAIVDREVIDAIKERRIEIVAGVESFETEAVRLADGTRLEADVVIAATGYRRGLEPLVGHLGVLDETGLPRARGAHEAAEGLRFVGYVPRPGGLGYAAKEAKRVATAIAHETAASPAAAR